uniref:Uncharacterized protein n=2 Tax=Lepeophtheirus salmonis TaxID=72036 RepID=A0A0K2V0D6_LEPSM
MKNYYRILIGLTLIIWIIYLKLYPSNSKDTFASKDNIIPESVGSDSTGKKFKGEKVRDFQKSFEEFNFRGSSSVKKILSDLKCKKWGVLTTINEPSEAVRRFSYDPSWCVVILGDVDSYKTDYKLNSSLGSNIIFLNDKDQLNIGSPFVNALPWRSFGRKNIGYFYAIAHGAEIIYDFDDDNMHKFWLQDSLPKTDMKTINDFNSLDMTFKTFKPLRQNGCQVFNPYPYLGGPTKSWPRGFPLDCLRGSNEIYADSINLDIKIDNTNPIGVLQSLAENEPDVDAIYRLTQITPFNFKPHKIKEPGIILPYGIYTPYNAQATLQFPPAYWALYLPISVSGRVSDILRSYIAKRLFDIFKIRAGFISYPLVVQIRNSHNFLADFNAEIPLYKKVSVLLNYLDSYEPKKNASGPEIILNLWIGLYEREYVEEKDVVIVQKWLQALLDIGYTFPHHKSDNNQSSARSNIVYNFKVGQTVSLTHPFQEVTSSCTQKKLWSPDYIEGKEIGPSLDSSLTLHRLRQKVYIGSSIDSDKGKAIDKEISNIVINKNADKMLDSFNKLLSDILDYKITQKVIQSTDVIYCHSQPSVCLQKKYKDKAIGFIPGTRYNSNKCKEEDWKLLNKALIDLQDGHGVVGSLSRFDSEYLRHYTNLDSKPFPVVGLVEDKANYQPKKDAKTILFLGSKTKSQFLGIDELGFKIEMNPLNYKDLNNIVAVIYIPEDFTSYKLTQFYSMNIPIFSPSLSFLGKNNLLSSSLKKICKSLTSIRPYIQTWHPFDPSEAQSTMSQLYWWQLSDSFDLPHIVHFKDEKDLAQKLRTSDLSVIREKMKTENQIRTALTKDSWCSFLSKIEQ